MQIQFVKLHSTYEEVQKLRASADCIMFDHKKLNTDDSFIVEDESFEIRRQPLRLVVIKLSDLNREWKILHDRFRRNTMIIAADDEVRNNPEIVRFLDSQGVALLMTRRNADGLLSLEGLLRSLNSLKFKSLLVEDKIELIAEFSNPI